jgi:tetratricopeptide (TPR) repeat protein
MLENRQFGQQMFTYINQLNQLIPREEAAISTFGTDLAAIDKQLYDYSRRSTLSTGGLKVAQAASLQLGAGVPLSEVDAVARIADLMLETRVAPDRIRPLVESMARREPDAARTAILAARLALFDEDYKGLDAQVSRATSLLTAGDWLSRRELAVVLLDSALDFRPMTPRSTAESQRELESAMRWFGEAITHNNTDVEALWGFGTAASRLDKNLDVAEQALLAAYQRAPGNADIAMSLASLKGRQQQPEAMIPYLKDTVRFAYNLETRRWASDQLEELERYVAERQKVDEENRKQREEYEKMRAEYDKKYGKAKKKSGG